jgi:hypothetical protein
MYKNIYAAQNAHPAIVFSQLNELKVTGSPKDTANTGLPLIQLHFTFHHSPFTIHDFPLLSYF